MRRLVALAVCVLTLAACGGSGDDDADRSESRAERRRENLEEAMAEASAVTEPPTTTTTSDRPVPGVAGLDDATVDRILAGDFLPFEQAALDGLSDQSYRQLVEMMGDEPTLVLMGASHCGLYSEGYPVPGHDDLLEAPAGAETTWRFVVGQWTGQTLIDQFDYMALNLFGFDVCGEAFQAVFDGTP